MQKLAEICVRRPVFATMLILSLTVVGLFSFTTLGVDLFPKIDLPTITVTVVNPGAGPQEVETEITDKVESAVNTISGIDELRSTSVEGVSQVFVTFVLDKDADVAAQEIRDKVNLVVPDLPETAEEPTIQKLDTDAAPVMRIVVSAPRALRDVTDVADKQIKKRIESIGGVGQVQIIGGARREIQVKVDPDKMRAFNVTTTDVVAAVRQQNLEVPGGRVDEGARELTVRTMGRITNPADFNNVSVGSRGGYSVKVSDIGYVEDSSEEQRTAAYHNGQPAVTLVVSKQSGQNSVQVADAIKERLAEIGPTLPKDVKVEVVADNSIFIKAAVESIQTHLVEGGILAALVVFVFLWNFRSTIIAGIAIPTSIVATFGLMGAMGYTLNQITMLALTLMVGIVIDDAIVVLENIYRYIEEKGYEPFQAAIEGTREIGLAVMATTFSLLAVFLPVGFMKGIVGRFMSSFGFTASFAIAVSLLVSFTLTPMLSARLIKRRREEHREAEAVTNDDQVQSVPLAEDSGPTPEVPAAPAEVPAGDEARSAKTAKDSRFYRPIDRTYTWLLRWSMAHRWAVVALCVLVVMSTVPLFMLIGKNFLPVDDQSQFEVTLRAPEGSTLASTKTVTERIAKELRALPGVTDTLVTIGGGQQELVNSANIYVRLLDIGDRELSQIQLQDEARKLLEKYPKELRPAVGQVQAFSGGGFRNADVQYVVSGPDLQKLTEYSGRILEKLETIPDVVDPDTSLITGKPEVRVHIDRARAADMGVRVGDIAQTLNVLVAGQVATTYNQGTDQYDVRVRATGESRASQKALENLFVASTKT